MRAVVLLSSFTLLLLASSGVRANAAATEEMQTVVVTARAEEPGSTPAVPASLPAVSAGLRAEQLQQTVNLTGVEDALKNLPSLDVRKRFIGDRASPVASRTTGSGFGARGLVYADDMLLSNLLGNDNTTYTPRWSMVAPTEIQRVDVIYGPYSALYPGNAMGSVVLLSTRMPEQFEAHVSVQGFHEALEVYGTDESYTGSQLSAALGTRAGAFSVWLGANHLDSRGHPMSFVSAQAPASTTATNTATGAVPDKDMFGKDRLILGATGIDHTVQDNFKLKLAYELSDNTVLSYTLGLWQNDSDISYDSYLKDSSGNAVYNGLYRINGISYNIPASSFRLQQQETEHWLQALALQGRSTNWSWQAVASLYDYGSDEARVQASTQSSNGTLTRMDGTGWKTLDLRGEWHPPDLSHALSFGYHLDQYNLQTLVQNVANWLSSDSGTRNSAFSGETQTQAVYVQDAWQLSPQWQAVLGLRYEQWQAAKGSVSSSNTTQNFFDRDEAFSSPKAALSYRPTDDLTLRASIGRAYRLPTVAELYQGSLPNGANNVVYNNPDLQPEKVLASELNAEYFLASGMLRATVFNEDNEDALIKQTVPGVVGATTYFMNVGKIRTRGAELAWQGEDVFMPRFDLSGSLTYARSEILEDTAHPEYVGKTNYRLPLWRAKVVGTFRQTEKLDYSLAGRYSGRQYATLDNTDTNPNTYFGFASYTVFDAKVNYRINRQFLTSVGVDNLVNKTYFQFHPYQGRTVIGEIRFDY
ncbi:MAG: TonB-dependent receptor [Moraxellaceae bacterium]